MLRRIHGDEIGNLITGTRRPGNGHAAELVRRREHLRIGIDFHDVVITGDRPVRSILTLRAVMHRRFIPQPLEIGIRELLFEQVWVRDIQLFEGNIVWIDIRIRGDA